MGIAYYISVLPDEGCRVSYRNVVFLQLKPMEKYPMHESNYSRPLDVTDPDLTDFGFNGQKKNFKEKFRTFSWFLS
jgi:hypothetical protein